MSAAVTPVAGNGETLRETLPETLLAKLLNSAERPQKADLESHLQNCDSALNYRV
ncbi:MAG TPA: hypothetical protein VN930_12420 [Xanthobacteraceae bacterium]|nr:hypothetical protein [Xanthobacteraceae bacterium]